MLNSESQGRTNPYPVSSAGFGADSRNRIKKFFGDFNLEMKTVMRALLTDGQDLELSGFKIPDDQKNGAAATYLLENWREEQGFILNQLLDSYKIGIDMAKKIDNLFSS